jgi:ABC-type Fe3+ transport system substrate-binding protein
LSDVLVYATFGRAATARGLLASACQATGIGVQLELYGTGSLYQRLGPRHAPPLPDIVFWSGPFAAQSATLDGLLQPYQPPSVAVTVPHEASWRWTTLDFSAVGAFGSSIVSSLQEVAAVPTLAMADPERSEIGLSIVLAVLDRARQVDGDVERGWDWWLQRRPDGLVLVETDDETVARVAEKAATHGLTLADAGVSLPGLAPLPNAISLAASSRNLDAARRLLDWLTSEAAGAHLRLSPWQAQRNGLEALLAAAPTLDIEWARQQYAATRQRWAHSAFGPTIKG